MRIALIGCMVLAREVSYALYQSKNTIQCSWLEQGLHNTPEALRQRLQEEIDRIESRQQTLPAEQKADAIVLAYGLCSNGVVGLRSRTLPLVVPRCDDCISLFLGSRRRYLDLFHSNNGIYWFTKGWVENSFIPSKENYDALYAHYVKEYGEENAAYLMEVETSFIQNYENAFFIQSPIYDDSTEAQKVRETAGQFGWDFREVAGDLGYISNLVNGIWDEERFLVCPPNKTIVADYQGKKIAEGD